ncbi:MAG: hypothetical protein IPP25_15980 [Saprospiraceae bacterium]|nr:hypothetical protein [Candidatus Opimibacter skivensis]
MSDQDRFADPGTILAELATHFIVHCPKCNGKALINPHEDTWRLTCTSCFHVEKPGHWYGSMTAYVSVKCRECRNLLTRTASVDGQWKKMKMKCDQCGDECEYEAHLSKHAIHHGLMTDPVFGLPLWLQKNVGDDLFWAYHYDHLSLLEQYVRAKLRERGIDNKGSKNSLMFSRLPAFITKAGNREEMLKLIGELQVKSK